MEKWAILATKENFKEISNFYVKHTNNSSTYTQSQFLGWYFHSHCNSNISIYNHKNFSYCSTIKREGFQLITFEEFKEHVLNQKSNKLMQKLTIPVTELLEIHIIACSSWKTKIAQYLTRVDENQNVTFTQQEVDEMFEAATSNQKSVLIKIFGEKKVKMIEGWFVNSDSDVLFYNKQKYDEKHKNVWKTKEQAKACLAMSELSQLMYEANFGWIPDYLNGNERKYAIYFINDRIETDYFYNSHHFLSFKTEEIRDKFLEIHRELILKAKPLL